MGILDMLTSVMAARAAKELDPAVIPAILAKFWAAVARAGCLPLSPNCSRQDLAIR
jgi:hypothetical protein